MATTEDRSEQVDLGLRDELGRLPCLVEVAGGSYYLVEDGAGGLSLLSTVCPHKGGEVEDVGTCFECPRHGWRFDRRSGRSLNAPSQGLARFHAVETPDGRIVAELPVGVGAGAPHGPKHPVPLTVQLHAHACLEIRSGGFSLLTDPWLAGPAFFGAWTQYPPPVVDVDRLRPDAIWISHEHSDHFHEPTLRRLPRTTPVYVPDFPNGRMQARLAEWGFESVHAMPFGERTELGDGFAITCFEPATLWNDAIVLVEVGDFRLLNLNDAGINHRIARLVAPVDLIASTFSPGASGYPLTWVHLSDEEKTAIMERARRGSLDMLADAARVYGARFVLPFASFFTLWHPGHRDYVSLLRKNAPADVVGAFAHSDVEVLDLLPGEAWNAANGKRTHRQREGRHDIFATARMAAYADERWDETEFAAHYPASERPLAPDELEAYLLRLNEAPEMRFCEELTGVVRSLDGPLVEAAFAIGAGRLELLAAVPEEPNLTIELPGGILERIVRGDVSWDEAFIGYWCRLHRSPNVYHAGFWRLLQAPYYGRSPGLGDGRTVEGDAAVAHVLETHGERAGRILRRHGLYCFGCQYAPFETLRHAGLKHGLSDPQIERLVEELNETLPAPAEVDAR